MDPSQIIIDGNFFTIFLWFFAYCFLGWAWESLFRSISERRPINTGFLVGPYCPIYGAGALLLIFLMHFTTRPVELFFIGGLLACALEYVTSFTLEKIFHARWWDYSNRMMNLNGRICIGGFLVFGTFAVIMPYVHYYVSNSINFIQAPWLQIISIILASIMLSDVAATNTSLVKFNKALSKYQKELNRRTGGMLDLIRRGRYRIELQFNRGKRQTLRFLSYQQRRIMDAFPGFRSIKYPEAFKRLRKMYDDADKRFRENRYKPRKIKQPRRKKSHKKTEQQKGQSED